jgi:phenylacetate-CoA ligase
MPQTFFQNYLQVNPEERLAFQIEYLNQHSPYYKRIFSSVKVPLNELHLQENFTKIPFTEKADLQNYHSDFCCVNKEKIIDYSATSGTSGEPVIIMLTESDLQRLSWNECRSFQIAGCKQNDLIQLMTTMDRRFMAGLAYFMGARELGAGIIRLGNGVPELQWESIIKSKPNVVICVPSFLLKLIDYAVKNGIDYKNSGIKKAICIGEPLRNSDFKLNTLGKKIIEQWPIELYSTYASSEMGAAFTECNSFKGGHLISELLHIEIIDESGNNVKNGEEGELVITNLGMEAMPLLRFKTGDICRMETEVCACGNKSPRLSPVLGRKNQMIKYKGTTLYPSSLFEILDGIEGVKNYQVEVCENEIGTDEMKVYIGCDLEEENLTEQIKERFRSRLRVVPGIFFDKPDDLAKKILPEHSRKAIKFIDNRKKI